MNNDFLHYLRFYFSLAGDKILLFIALSGVSTSFTAVAATCFMAVLKPEAQGSSNRITRTVESLLSKFGVDAPDDRLLCLLLVSSVAFLFAGAFLLASRLFVVKIETALFKRLQSSVIDRMFKANYEYYTSKNIGHLTNALITQILSVATSFSFVGTLTINSLQAALFLCLPFFISLKMTLVAVCLGVLYLPLMRLINRKTKRYSIENSYNFSAQSDIIIQMLSNFKYLKATQTWLKVASMVAERTRRICRILIRMALWNGLSGDAIQPIAVCCMTAIFYYQVKFANIDRIDAIMLLGFLFMAYQKAITIPVAVQKFLASAGSIQIYEELDAELSAEQEPPPQGKASPDFSGPLKFDKVSFSYRSSPAKVLDQISLEIPQNAYVAFVGGSGAGKSTIVNMVAGLLRPTEGSLSLSDKKLPKLDMPSYRSQIGYVTQEAVVFNDSVANNISLWETDADMKRIKAAAGMASADSFINAMKDGFDTVLGDRGIALSGGQRQRITIARELMREGKILILDEATSALDTETEQAIQKSIDSIRGSKTVILIAHRLSTVRSCDTIFVLDGGRLVESGSYSELLQKGGKFKEMVERQSLGLES